MIYHAHEPIQLLVRRKTALIILSVLPASERSLHICCSRRRRRGMLDTILALCLNVVPRLAHLLKVAIDYDRRWGNNSTLFFLCRDLTFVL